MSRTDEDEPYTREDLDFLRLMAEQGEKWGRNANGDFFNDFLAKREVASAMAEETAEEVDAKVTAYLDAVVYLHGKISKADPFYNTVYLLLHDNLPGQKPSRRSRRKSGI